MKKIVFAVFLYAVSVGTPFAAAPTAEPARTAGDIYGTVNICEQLGIDRVFAYIPGRSYMAWSDGEGSFQFNFVPPGNYQIVFESEAGATVSSLSGVVVHAKQKTDLGIITVCIDADNDGFDATQDCDDGNAEINPGAIEVCNFADDNCDGFIDEGYPTETFYIDADNDSYGNPDGSVDACTSPSGYVNNYDDCDDSNAAIYPGAVEVCNGFDDNCNAAVDQAEVPNSVLCPAGNNVDSTTCFGVSGCQITACSFGYDDCDSVFNNGCECLDGPF